MAENHTPDADRAAGSSPSSGAFAKSDPLFCDDGAKAKARSAGGRGLLGRLARRWWQILGLWLVVFLPIAFCVWALVKPTYVASSIVRIEPALRDVFGPMRQDYDDPKNDAFLKTQVSLITSDKVLNPVLADALVVNLPVIKDSIDPRTDLREGLQVEIIKDTNLIRVSLELPDPREAKTIVEAVVQSYMRENSEYSRSANRELTKSLKSQIKIFEDDIGQKRAELKSVAQKAAMPLLTPREMLNPKTETDPTQPTVKRLTSEQFARLVDKQVQCDVDYLDAISALEAVRHSPGAKPGEAERRD